MNAAHARGGNGCQIMRSNLEDSDIAPPSARVYVPRVTLRPDGGGAAATDNSHKEFRQRRTQP